MEDAAHYPSGSSAVCDMSAAQHQRYRRRLQRGNGVGDSVEQPLAHWKQRMLWPRRPARGCSTTNICWYLLQH